MKNILITVAAFLALAVASNAQQAVSNSTFTATGVGETIRVGSGGIQNHFLTVIPIGTPGTETVTLQGSVIGDFSDAATCATTSSTTPVAISCSGIYTTVRVNLSVLTNFTSLVTIYNGFATNGSAGTVQGTAAAGATATGNPVMVGGSNNTTMPILTNGQAGIAQLDTKSALIVSPGVSSALADGASNTASILRQINAIVSGGGNLASDPFYFNGTTWDRQTYCPNTATFSVASTTTQVVGLSGTTKVRICSFGLNPTTSTAGAVDIVYGTGANCVTGTTTLTGAYTLPASAVVNIGPVSLGTGALTTIAGQAVCIRTVTSTVAGFITWEQH